MTAEMAADSDGAPVDPATTLAGDIRAKLGSGEESRASLAVDDRVLARVTDGIYRRPSSAFRELVSNAYDADASHVTIKTDAPRFDRITIRDNGNGMAPEVVADFVCHIGGSSKRTQKGKQLDTVSQESPDRSPGGRPLIGKIGIGLFSVAQLTQHFQIITKKQGDDFRTSADVVLRTFTEDYLDKKDADEFDTGEAVITTEATSDVDAHGTEVILMDLREQTKDILRSAARWLAVDESIELNAAPPSPPKYHIGRVQRGEPDVYALPPALPWSPGDKPAEKFLKLFDTIGSEVKTSRSNPNLESALDNYLEMLWLLSLAVPVQYIHRSPFDLGQEAGIAFFELSNKFRGGSAEPLDVQLGRTVGQSLGLTSAKSDPVGEFRVLIDDVELLRPVAFENELLGPSNIPTPLMFFGKCDSGLGGVPALVGGGELEFEAYIYWNSKIISKDNIGVLVRINNASGTLFDPTFMNYRVSELTRLRQLTAEVFITKGLDPALNIDRESFNYSHPHYQFLMRWVHSSVRQVTNRLKNLAADALIEERQRVSTQIGSELVRLWARRRGDEPAPEVVILEGPSVHEQELRAGGKYVFLRDLVLTDAPSKAKYSGDKLNDRVRALVTVLEAYSLFSELSYSEQEELLRDLLRIL